MKKLLIALVALCVIVIAFFFFAPASLLNSVLQDKTGGALTLRNADGSLLHGGGEIAMTSPDGGVTLLPNVKWRVDPMSLVTGEVRGQLESGLPGGIAQGEFMMKRGEQFVKNLRLSMPAASFTSAVLLATLSPGGQMEFQVPDAKWGEAGGDGAGKVLWRDASVQLPNSPGRVGLGQVIADFQMQGPSTTFNLRNEGGTVQVTGSGSLERGVARYEVAIVPGPSMPPDQVAALNQIGRPDGQGRIIVRR